MELAWSLSMADAPSGAVSRDEAALIAASLGGDPAAFEDLVRLHQNRVFRLAGRFFRNREDVEDAAQDTFLTVWRRLATYRGRAPFEHWLTRVCLNCCYARFTRPRGIEEPIGAQDPPAPSPSADATIEVGRLMHRLPAPDRFILLLLDGEGWSVAEIAQRLGWSSTNVKVRAFRARRKLRRMLEEG
jgi:RNA polymerase sigma-70 factor (ECF subfamily)